MAGEVYILTGAPGARDTDGPVELLPAEGGDLARGAGVLAFRSSVQDNAPRTPYLMIARPGWQLRDEDAEYEPPFEPGTLLIEAIREVLLDDPTVAGMVGERVHIEPAPQRVTPPFIVLRTITDLPLRDLGGGTSRQRNATVQVDAYGKTYVSAQRLGAAVNHVLGARTDPSLLSSRIGRRDEYDDEAELHRCSSDFSVWMEEA